VAQRSNLPRTKTRQYAKAMAITDPPFRGPYQVNASVPLQGGSINIGGQISSGFIASDKIVVNDHSDWHLPQPQPTEDAVRMVQVADDLACQMGISLKEAMEALQSAAGLVRARAIAESDSAPPSPQMSVTVDEYGLLMRVAHMAAQLLPALRESGISEKEYGRYTALRNALVALQMHETTLTFDALGEDELARDLAALASELAEPSPAPTSP